MKKVKYLLVSILVSLALFFSSCSFMEMSGKMTRQTGETMTEYSKKNKGFLGSMAGFGGKVNTAVGSAVENAARNPQSDKSKTEQFLDVNKKVITAASSAAFGDPEKEKIYKAQRRLNELGFDAGPADGIIGNKTTTAIAQYQESNKLKVTKCLDEDTCKLLGIE